MRRAKSLFAAGFMLEPRVGDGAELVDMLLHLALRDDLEAHALLLRAAVRVAEIVRLLAGQRELREVDARTSATFSTEKAHVEIGRQVGRADGVVDGTPTRLVGELAQPPDQIRRCGRIADRIAHRNPAPAEDAVHQERALIGSDDEFLVAEERDIRLRSR